MKKLDENQQILNTMRISYSSLDSFKNCPAKYKFSEIDKIKTSKSKEAALGTIIHESLRMLHNPSNAIKPSEDNFLRFFAEKWDKNLYTDPAEEAAFFDLGVRMLKDYYKKNFSLKFDIVDLETRFETPIADSAETHKIVGKIDRIDKIGEGQFEIIDYKTAKKLPSQDQVNDNLQLAVYHLGLINRWPHLKNAAIKVSLYFLKHNEKLSTTRGEKNIKETEEKILDIISEIKKSKFEPNPNPLCDWCEFMEYCPIYKHKFVREKIKDAEIEKTIKEFLLIKEQSRQNAKRSAELADIVNQYCDENKFDRIFCDDGYITRSPQKRYSYDEQKIAEILKSIGKWEKVLSFDAKKLKEIFDNLPQAARQKIEEAKTVKKEFKMLSGKRLKTKN